MTTFKLNKTVPEVVAHDFSQRIFPKYKLGYDENHRIVILQDGVEDVQAKIEANAANCPSLAEICENQPGNGPLEKLYSAIESGMLPPPVDSDQVNDFTEAPESITEMVNTANAARSLLGGKAGNLEELIKEKVAAEIAKYQEEAAKAAPSEKGEAK